MPVCVASTKGLGLSFVTMQQDSDAYGPLPLLHFNFEQTLRQLEIAANRRPFL
jgi:hypothetical protein